MNRNTNEISTPPFCKLECVVGILTALVLVSVLGVLTTDFRSYVNACFSSGTVSPETPTVESSGWRPDRIANKAGSVREAQSRPSGKIVLNQMETEAETQETLAPAGVRTPVSQPPLHDFIGKTVLAIAMVFALAIISALVFAHCFFGLLRRHSVRFGPLVRFEYAGAPPMVVGPFTASSVGVGSMGQDAGLERNNRFEGAADSIGASAANRFDLGPTLETEQNIKKGQAKRQEEALLQHLFEANLQLHGQIGVANEKHRDAAKELNG